MQNKTRRHRSCTPCLHRHRVRRDRLQSRKNRTFLTSNHNEEFFSADVRRGKCLLCKEVFCNSYKKGLGFVLCCIGDTLNDSSLVLCSSNSKSSSLFHKNFLDRGSGAPPAPNRRGRAPSHTGICCSSPLYPSIPLVSTGICLRGQRSR